MMKLAHDKVKTTATDKKANVRNDAPRKEKNPKIREYYGSGWVGPGLTVIFLKMVPK